jgi:hypothetical protein
MLKINTSVEYINAKNTQGLNQVLSLDFFKSLGESNTLKYLDLSNSGPINATNFENFGKAIAFNALKKG